MKFKHDQRRHNKSIKDEDAYYKSLSYAAMHEKHHLENMKNYRNDFEQQFNWDSFDQHYYE